MIECYIMLCSLYSWRSMGPPDLHHTVAEDGVVCASQLLVPKRSRDFKEDVLVPHHLLCCGVVCA